MSPIPNFAHRLVPVVLFSICSYAAVVQSFDANDLAGSGAGGAGFMNPFVYSATTPSPCTDNTQMYPEGTWSVGPNAHDCHRLWAPTTAQSGSTSNFLIVNGSATVNGRIYSQVVNTGGSTSGIFSGFFTGLYTAQAANLSMNIYDGPTSAVLGTFSFDTNLATNGSSSSPDPASWALQFASFSGATGSTIVVEISLNNAIAGGNDFGIDTLDVTFGLGSSDPLNPSTVPEPASFLLCGSVMVGFALLGPKRDG